MEDLSVTCSCGRVMAPVGSLGPGHYRCANCRTRVNVTSPLLRTEEGRCAWISRKRCSEPRFNDLPVCRRHAQSIAEMALREDDIRKAIATRIGASEFHSEMAEERERLEAKERQFREQARDVRRMTRPPVPTVYYVRLGPHTIKIGTSVWFPQRMAGLRIAHEAAVLAAEPGGFEVERERHKQFAHLRYDAKREDFRDDPDLMSHIEAVRAEHGDPYELLHRMVAEIRNHQ